MNGYGILEVGNKEYLILNSKDARLTDVTTGWHGVSAEADSFYVARRMFVESTKDNILSGEEIFLNPRWVSVVGPYVINWFPEPVEKEVKVTWEGKNGS